MFLSNTMRSVQLGRIGVGFHQLFLLTEHEHPNARFLTVTNRQQQPYFL